MPLKTIERKIIICDVCGKVNNLDKYWEITTKDDEVWYAHHNCGLYVKLSLPFLKKTGLLTGFHFKEKSQYNINDAVKQIK